MKQKIIVTAVAVIVLFAIAYLVKVRTPGGHEVAAPSVPKPTVPSGHQEYRIAQAAEALPPIRNAVIDPPDVHVGNTQHLSITVEADAPLPVVRAQIETDHGIKILPLTEEKVERNLRTYSGSWIVKDTHDTTYHTKFVVQDTQGHENSFVMAWTDACSIPQGGNWTLSSACTISSADGIDNGNVTISAGGSLTLNASFAYNAGFSVSISGGSVAIGSGQGFRQTNIWQVDADADNYISSSTQYLQDSAPTNGRRRYLLNTAIDCNDGSASLYQNLTGYQDSDSDTFTTGASQQVCSGASLPSGWRSSANGSDCNDGDGTKWQNLTGYPDSDGDGVSLGASQQVCSGSSLPAGYVASSGSDCNDANATVQTSKTIYSDGDGDGYTVSGAAQCVSSGTGGCVANYSKNESSACVLTSSLSGTDCYDASANAKPGQTAYFTTNRGDGSFDYDCGGSTDYFYSDTNNCVQTLACAYSGQGPAQCHNSECAVQPAGFGPPACGTAFSSAGACNGGGEAGPFCANDQGPAGPEVLCGCTAFYDSLTQSCR